jgi:hypothetical protein
VPALLGLKGNLEMTLASRLSTQANLGNLDTARSQWHMSVGNLSLVQVSCQFSFARRQNGIVREMKPLKFWSFGSVKQL